MSSLIAEKYANLLTMEDVVRLFKLLEDEVGNKVEAARLCGLERKTTYGWEATHEIRLRTKEKVLAALIENLTEETLEFITKRSVETSVDVLRTYITAIYEKAMDERIDAPTFLRLTSKFEEIKQRYGGLIIDFLEIEVGNMSMHIPEKANELRVPSKVSPVQILRLTELSRLLPNLIKTISSAYPYVPDTEIAKVFNLPSDFVGTLSTSLHENYVAIRAPEVTIARITPSPYERVPDTAGTVDLREPQFQETRQQRAWIEKHVGGLSQ